MNARASLWASLAIAASIGLAGCGGSSDNGDGMDPKPVSIPLSDLNIPGGMEPGDAMIDLAAGRSAELNGVKFTCAADGDPCKVMVKDGMAEATGGKVTPSLSQAAMDAIARIEGKDDRIEELEGQVEEKDDRITELENKDQEEADAEDDRQMKMMAATAAKLHAGISASTSGTVGQAGSGADHRFSAYVMTAETPTGAKVGDIVVGIGRGAQVILSEDDKTTVAANHEWEGKRYIDAPGDDSYEAIVYSNVGDPMEGEEYGETYTLNDNDELAEIDFSSGKIVIPSFTQTSGHARFKRDDNQTRVMLPGSHNGVSGHYYCTPTSNAQCAVNVGDGGLVLGGVADNAINTFVDNSGTWHFKPSDPKAKVTEMDDSKYSSYGWWLMKTADGQTYTASAFHDFKGSDTPTLAVPTAGTAKYMGGAAGKYAFSSSTGGLNEAGHFTARAELTATWGTGNAGTIDGTIDTFKVGDDAEDRAWIVHLHDAQIAGAASGTIGVGGNNKANTTWEQMEDDADASANGSWSGKLREQGEDGVPGAVTGVFYSEYGNAAGKMVGAFGAAVE